MEVQVMSLAARLRQGRLKKGLSLQDAADAIGISKAHLWDLEMGKSSNPGAELLGKFSDQYGLPIGHLVGELESDQDDDRLKVMFRQLRELGANDLELIETIIEQRKRQQKSQE
jgi:transcriptional regulator with XRE-family HTH domain